MTKSLTKAIVLLRERERGIFQQRFVHINMQLFACTIILVGKVIMRQKDYNNTVFLAQTLIIGASKVVIFTVII